MTQGYVRQNTNNRVATKIQLQATCAKIIQGNALRFSLSAASFPAYAMNHGSHKLINKDRLIDAKIITLTVSCGGAFASQILLPIVSLGNG